MSDKKIAQEADVLKGTPKDAGPDTGQGTSPEEKGLFECHEEDGELCDGRMAPTPAVDAAHPVVKKVEPAKNAERAKDERALFDCDEKGEKCDA